MVTYCIIALTCITSILAFQNTEMFHKYLFNPYIINRNKEWQRFFTHALLHADWTHLLMNMFVLYSFGRIIENYYFDMLFGPKASLFFALLYVGAVVASSVPSYEKHKNDSYYNSVGASGAVSAVVFSSILIEPTQKIVFLFLPFPIPAVVFGILYLFYSRYMAKKENDNIGHDAHFWGAVFGIIFTLMLKPGLGKLFLEQVLTML